MGTNRLQLYQDALLLCKEKFLAALTDNVESRRLLDNVWASDGIQYCLEQGQWQFAMRTQRIDYDPNVTTQFGYRYAFDKPADWVLTSALCSDERFISPLTQYSDETDYWTADITPIYIKFVSNDVQFGNNLSRWPASFTDYVAAYFASQIVGKLGKDEKTRDAILHPRTGILDRALLVAKNRAAMTQGTKYPATGSWVKARRGIGTGRGPLGDGGLGGQL